MYFTKRLITILLCALLCAPAMPAQDRKADSQARDVTIIIQQEQVRFTTQKAVQMMQLQVFNPSGEAIFDSGPVTAGEINWPFQNANGEALKSGLYAYTLSIHESGAAEARMRRGHFIVDRVKDRDGKTDKLWVTSRHDDGIGTELTVARNEGSAIAGTSADARAGGAALEADEIPEGQVVKKLNGLTDDVTLEAGTNVAITPNGNTLKIDAAIGDGQVVKGLNGLTDQVTLEAGPNVTITPNGNTLTIAATGAGNSNITELNGNIGIGTENPLTKFHVVSAESNILPPRLQSSSATSYAAGWDFYHGTAGKGYVGVPGSSASLAPGELMLYAAPGTKTSLWAGGRRGITVDTNGAVGIGTSTPFGELHIHGLNPFITLSTAAGANAHIQNAGGTLVFKPTGFGSCCAAMVMQANTGNVGIGTSAPQAKLHVEGGGPVEATIKSVNQRAFLSLNSTINGQNRVWSLESGIYGNAGWFGIYDWQAKRGRLAIDPAGLVYVDALKITGGADFAENFDVNEAPASSEATTKIETGMVVSIDPTNPGKLQLSTQAYNRRVAGIISGAGGVKPGMMMSQEGTLADGQHPVALSGRVYCWVDASRGAVEPGDLLTTSSTPGHAMKAADREKAQGAIIGKAMTGLKEGKGLVLVLVTLQ